MPWLTIALIRTKHNIQMDGKYFAAIDIGSNAVRLLVKRVSVNEQTGEDKLSKDLLLRVPLRLGFDVFAKGKISKTRAKNLMRMMSACRQLMDIYNVAAYRACATSAMRDAKNGKELIKKIKREADINIEIINGQEEAQMIYNNHIEFLGDRTGNYMYVDVGGGSTEVNFIVAGKLVFSKSFNIGTVRILTGGVSEAAWQNMRDMVEENVRGYENIEIIGSGGNINKLYKLVDTKDKTKKSLPVSALSSIYEKLSSMTEKERMDIYNLKPDRADVIVPASRIFLTLAEVLKSKNIFVPVIGLSDGIIDSLYLEELEKEKLGNVETTVVEDDETDA